jgi:hypothetical protein
MRGMRLFAAAVVLSLLLPFSSAARADDGDKILAFEAMAAVGGPYVGATNAIRGVPGGGRPWVIRVGKGELRSDGRVEVKVRGLVLANGLTNPIAAFRVVVSCLSVDATGAAVTANVSTGAFPATPTGDADIEAAVNLPAPCYAPVLFVTSPTGAWFAATGR